MLLATGAAIPAMGLAVRAFLAEAIYRAKEHATSTPEENNGTHDDLFCLLQLVFDARCPYAGSIDPTEASCHSSLTNFVRSLSG